MAHHRQSSTMREMAMPLMETPEQLEIMDLKEKLELNQKELEKTKSQLDIAKIELSDRASEIEGLKNTIQCLVCRDQASFEKIQQNDDFKAETESKFQMLDKKFDDLKEQISKGQEQEELQKLKDLNEKLVLENGRLQEELSNSITKTKELEECIEKFEKTDIKKDEKIHELKETIQKKESKLNDLKKELSDVVDKFEKKDLECEELKKKCEETVVKLEGMDKLQKTMEKLELKNSQLQLQYQQQQQQQGLLKDNHISIHSDSVHSKGIKECLFSYQMYLHAWLKNDKELGAKLIEESRRRYSGLSKEDQDKCNEIKNKYRKDIKKKKMNSQ